jgi:hypothetical protein
VVCPVSAVRVRLSRRCYEYRWIWRSRTSWPYPCPQRREQLAVGHADEPVLRVGANLAECQVSEVGLGEAARRRHVLLGVRGVRQILGDGLGPDVA